MRRACQGGFGRLAEGFAEVLCWFLSARCRGLWIAIDCYFWSSHGRSYNRGECGTARLSREQRAPTIGALAGARPVTIDRSGRGVSDRDPTKLDLFI
jgi:hypothetical protein